MEVVKALRSQMCDFTVWLCFGIATFNIREGYETRETKLISDRYEVHKEFA